MRFEWDPKKAQANKRKHGVTFEEAATCFGDEHARYYEEKERRERFVLIGVSDRAASDLQRSRGTRERSHPDHQCPTRHSTRTETL
jgi:Ribonuclease toxin, BrnT, of type II toxin-antitoxin system